MRDSGPLKTVGGALRHFWWIVCLLALFGAFGGYLAATNRPPTYQATAQLGLDTSQNINQGFDIALQADQFLSQRYINMATSRSVLDKACLTAKLTCDSISLAPRVSATNSRTTGVILINVTSRSPVEAAVLANAIANQVVAQNRAQIEALITPTRAYLAGELKRQDDQIQAIRNQLAVVQKSGGTEGTIANQSAPLLSELNQSQLTRSATYAKLQELDVQGSRLQSTLSVQQDARPPLKPIDPNPPVYVLVGLAAGLLLGFLGALLAERLDDRIRDSAQLAEATGTHFVLEMSRASGGSRPDRMEREAASYALGHASMVARYEGVRSVLVVAATLGDQVAEVGLGLARAAAELGDRVLVIQSERGSNGGAEAIGATLGPGRSSRVVVEAADLEEQARYDLPSRDGFDLIVSCTPPPGYSSEAMSVVSATDVAIVVATRGRTRFRDARWTAELLRHTGVRLSGAILLGRNGARRQLARLAPLASLVPPASEAPEVPVGSPEAGGEAPFGNAVALTLRRRARALRRTAGKKSAAEDL